MCGAAWAGAKARAAATPRPQAIVGFSPCRARLRRCLSSHARTVARALARSRKKGIDDGVAGYFVGIDVSKGRLDVHLRRLGVGFSVSNAAAGHAALIARLRPLRVKRIVLEATGGV